MGRGSMSNNILSKLGLISKERHSKDCKKCKLFKRTAFNRKKWILKEGYLIKRPRHSQITVGINQILIKVSQLSWNPEFYFEIEFDEIQEVMRPKRVAGNPLYLEKSVYQKIDFELNWIVI